MGLHYRFALATVFLGAAFVLANVAAGPVLAQEPAAYPARVIAGSCSAPGQESFSLTEVDAAPSADSTPTPERERFGAADAIPLLTSTTILEGASITALTDDPYAITIYDSDDSSARMIACGAIGGILARQMGGMIMPGDVLNVGLGSIAVSRVSGIANLQSVEGATCKSPSCSFPRHDLEISLQRSSRESNS